MIADLQPFKDAVKNRCGLMLEGNGEETLKGALAARMRALGCATAQAYLARLLGSEAEFQELVTLLTINETYFFREPEQLSLLVDKLVPRLLAGRGGAPLRVLSAGCSTGEEPYSIAMALLDKYGESMAGLVHLFAGDIDHLALAKARAGHYNAFSFRGLSAERRERYFSPIGRHGFALAEAVRDKVAFHHLNLLSAEPPAALHDLDIVLFRNVSIYFDTATREAILRNLARLLKADGVLLVGTAETLANDLGVLPLVEEDGLFYFHKGAVRPVRPVAMSAVAAARRATLPAPPAAAPSAPAPTLSTPGRASVAAAPVSVPAAPSRWQADKPVAGLDEARRLTRDERYDEAALVLRQVLEHQPDDLAGLLLYAHVQIQRRAFAEAEILAHRVLEKDSWSVAAAVLLGFAARWQGDHEAAIRWFKQAVYARHDCWVAQYYLAESLRAQGQAEPARRAYRVALQHLAGAADPDGGLGLPLGLPVAEVRFLCERHAGATPAASPGGGRR